MNKFSKKNLIILISGVTIVVLVFGIILVNLIEVKPTPPPLEQTAINIEKISTPSANPEKKEDVMVSTNAKPLGLISSSRKTAQGVIREI